MPAPKNSATASAKDTTPNPKPLSPTPPPQAGEGLLFCSPLPLAGERPGERGSGFAPLSRLRERGRERGALDLAVDLAVDLALALLLSPARGREVGREGPLILLCSSLPLAGERPGERGSASLLSHACGGEAGREGRLILLLVLAPPALLGIAALEPNLSPADRRGQWAVPRRSALVLRGAVRGL